MRFNHSLADANLRPSDVVGLPVRHATVVAEFYRTAPRHQTSLKWWNAYTNPDYRFVPPPDDNEVPLIVYAPLPVGCYSVCVALALDHPVRTHSTPMIYYGIQFHMPHHVFQFAPETIRYPHWNPESRRTNARDRYPYNPNNTDTYRDNQPRRPIGSNQFLDWRANQRSGGGHASAPPYAWGYNPYYTQNNAHPASEGGVDPTENHGILELNYRAVRTNNANNAATNFFFVKPGVYIIDIAVPIVGLTGMELRLCGVNLVESTQNHERPATDSYTRPSTLASTANRVGIFGVICASTRPI